MTITVTRNWQRAIERALREGLKATKTAGTVGPYRVRSVSHPGTLHTVTLDTAGHIVSCSDCPGWNRYGRRNPCKHAGAVALARAFECGAHLVPASVPGPDDPGYRVHVAAYVIDCPTTRGQLFPAGV